MPFYEYRHPDTGETVTSQTRANFLDHGGKRFKRVWSFQMAPVMHEHLNPSTGTVVSSHRQFRDELARLSDKRSEATGIPHNYVEVDVSDKKALGVTDEGDG